MWNELKKNLYSARIYFKEFLLFNLLIFLIIALAEEKIHLIIILIFLLLLLNIFFLNLIGRKRNKEINEIRNIIYNIRKNSFTSSEEIILSRYLQNLQDEIKKMFEKTKNDIEYLKKLEKMRTEFLANVSHELRTPIFAIQGYIETLLDGAIDDENVNKNFLSKANRHTINLNNLLNDLIDISMIESGEMRMSFRYFDIDSYLKELISELIHLAKEKNIELLYIPPQKKLQLLGDRNKLRQALNNLIINAIKYTEEGKIEIIVEEEKGYGRIIIRDTGIGIAREDLERIFERFYRVDKARSRTAGGTGLGLAIVKHIIEAHDSRIEVKSELGKGSEFSFRLKK